MNIKNKNIMFLEYDCTIRGMPDFMHISNDDNFVCSNETKLLINYVFDVLIYSELKSYLNGVYDDEVDNNIKIKDLINIAKTTIEENNYEKLMKYYIKYYDKKVSYRTFSKLMYELELLLYGCGFIFYLKPYATYYDARYSNFTKTINQENIEQYYLK